jgi:hypothetical protein
MKIRICFTVLLLTICSVTFSQSVIDFGTGTIIEVGAGADICADDVNINGTFTGASTICGSVAFFLNLTAFIQGFYDPSLNTMVADTVTVYLRNAVFPFAKKDSAKSLLNNSGIGTFIFFNLSNSTNYYLLVKHRNSIETWSNTPIPFSAGTLTYDFTTAANKAYGNNQIQVDTSPVKFAIYSGDVNQDGVVNLTDLVSINNDANIFLTGYVLTDVNGDNIVNLADMVIDYNNSTNFVTVKKP